MTKMLSDFLEKLALEVGKNGVLIGMFDLEQGARIIEARM
jgi:hypothetical protein